MPETKGNVTLIFEYDEDNLEFSYFQLWYHVAQSDKKSDSVIQQTATPGAQNAKMHRL